MTITRRGNLTGLKSRGPTADDQTLTVTADQIETVVDPGESEEMPVSDTIRLQGTGATLDNDWQLHVSPSNPARLGYLTFTSLDTDVATVDSGGRITRVADGLASIMVRSKWRNVRADKRVWRTTPATIDQFQRFADGSLGKHASDAIDDAIAGKTPAVAKPIFSVQNHTAGIYERNPDCWAAGFNLTAFSPWNSRGVNLRAGTPITLIDVLVAYHYPLYMGDVLRFVGEDNTVYTRTIVKTQNPPWYMMGYPDIKLCRLNAELPAAITPVKLLPTDWADYLPTLARFVPLLVTDQEEKALVAELNTGLDGQKIYASIPVYTPESAARAEFYETLVGGDSGNPVCLIVNNHPVLLGVNTSPGPICTSINGEAREILDDMLADIGGGYNYEVADITEFENEWE